VDQEVKVLQYPRLSFGYRLPPRSGGALALLGFHAPGHVGLGLADERSGSIRFVTGVMASGLSLGNRDDQYSRVIADRCRSVAQG
jgi:hypothetical protein